MKTIVIGDIHGCYNELKKLIQDLQESGEYNKKKDKLVFLGDYIDRGKDSRLVIEYIRKLQRKNKNVIALMGNHEDMLLNYYYGDDETWTFNGSEATMKSYKGNFQQFQRDIKWMENLPIYHEDKHFIYVHAGIDASRPMKNQSRNTLLWVREPFIWNKESCGKTVIFGHTPTLNLSGEDKPIYTVAGNVGIDTACVYGGALTALIINNDKIKGFYQVEKEVEKKKTDYFEYGYFQEEFTL